MALLHVLVCVAIMGGDDDSGFNRPKPILVPVKDPQFTKRDKQVLVHLTPAGFKVFTPNRPSPDKDLLDRIPPTNELLILCDGMEQSTMGGRLAWKFTGNVHLIATKVTGFCHELTLTQDTESLQFDITGGWDANSTPAKFEDPSSQDGNAYIAGERGANQPFEFNGGVSFHAGQMKQKLDTGAYQIIIKKEEFKGRKI